MKLRSPVLVLFLFLAPSAAQQKVTVNLATPEGQLLQQVRVEPDDQRKLALIEKFLAQYPKHEGAVWINSQMMAVCVRLGQFDKALATADALLAQDPNDVETAFAAVKAAEAKKDADALRKWAVRSFDIAQKVGGAPKTAAEDDDAFKQRVDGAKQVATYTEYALYAMALQVAEPAKKAELLKTLEERAPESVYLSQGSTVYFLALVQSGQTPAAVAVAEKAIAKGQGTELMLATAGDFYLHQNRDPQKVLEYSAKLMEMLNSKPKPDGVSDADWQKAKNYLLGWGMWMTGAVYSSQSKFEEANKTLRAALPLLGGNDENKAGALFNLGLANSQIRNVADALKFYEECAAIKSPYERMCAENLKTIRSTYRVVK